MKKKFFETASFKKLNREWYQKLREEGFVDTESKSNIDNDSVTRQEFKVEPRRLVYIQQCEAYLASGSIVDPLDLFIFANHCDGRSTREIERLLKAQEELEKIHQVTIVRRLQKILATANIEPVDFGSV